MATKSIGPSAATHAVVNQSEPLAGYNVFAADRALVEAVAREGGDFEVGMVREVGEIAGRPETIELGRLANEHPPRLRAFDRYGHRIDEVEFHPAWHEVMAIHVSHGLHSLPWRRPEPGAHVARAAAFMCISQAEAGSGCPISMTYSVIPALRCQPEVATEWEPRFTSLDYDPRMVPAPDKAGALAGMAMTEKQGGSDVRANTTVAVPLNGGGPGAEYELTGHKWFCSAPMCDAFLVLAQAEGGLSCFLLPRWTPDGERNGLRVEQLKDKLGNRSNASSEIELRGAWARMVGAEGRGVATIIEMVSHTRLDCTLGSTAGMRAGTAQAIWHCEHRSAFGRLLVEQPLMANVLADLAIESEAATVAGVWLARQFDEAHAGDERAGLIRRIATPVLKYWTCKRAPEHAAEALECLGGNGYVEDSGMPRLYREAPVMSVWEGSGNVQALDALRALAREPAVLEPLLEEIGAGAEAEPRLRAAADSLERDLADGNGLETRARRLVERTALALQGSLLVRWGDPAVADAFCATRLDRDWGNAFGTLPPGVDTAAIIERHAVRI
ncbi:MAG: DNA alkylation response protein [Acidobacteria bacterium]|nr:MAG: DNA alkylation response protein [Acidobacteriota bacterium]GIK77849.1 MAG: acyl-CoA dehydrogenase [Actinomycetes bacterium]